MPCKQHQPKMAEVDNLLLSLIEKEIPEGRQALRDGHENLAKVAAYCEQKYVETNNRYKSGADRGKALEETRAVLEETKQFATQSLASVAYQINTLALNMLGLLDQQVSKLQDMESKINHISETVNIHKEKVARREIGVLASSKTTGRTHRIIAPAEQEKPTRYSRRTTDYSILDHMGHGVKTSDRSEKRRQSTKKLKPQPPATGNKGSLRQPLQGTSRRTPLVKPPPPPVPPPMPPSVPFSESGSPPPPSVPVPPAEPLPPANDAMAPPPPPPPLPGVSSTPSSPGIPSPPPPPGTPSPPPPPSIGGPVPSPPPPPPLALQGGAAHLPPPDLIPPSEVDGGSTYESVVDAMSPLPPPPSEDDFYASPSSLPMPAPPEDLYQVPPPPPVEGQSFVPKNYIEKVVSLYEYAQQRDDELTFQEGVIIYVIKKNDDGWYEGVTEGGATGLFPGNYVEVCL